MKFFLLKILLRANDMRQVCEATILPSFSLVAAPVKQLAQTVLELHSRLRDGSPTNHRPANELAAT